MENNGPRPNFNVPPHSRVQHGIRSLEVGCETPKRSPCQFDCFWRNSIQTLLSLVLLAFAAVLTFPCRAEASPGTLVFNPSSANFGNVTVGSSKTISISITNTGTTTVAFSKESLVANMYAVSGFTLPSSLGAGKSMTISVNFTPSSSGTFSGYILFGSNASNAQVQYGLSGVGVSIRSAQLISTPSTANLGTAPTGTTNSLVLQLKNTGRVTVSISGATLTGSSDFKLCKLTYPLSLTPGQTTNCTVQLTPSSAGSKSGGITFSSNAALTVSLSGQGTTATRALAVTPTSLNFGNVTKGKSETLAVNLKNTGNSSVVISGITTSSSVLTTSGGVQGATIAAGQSATLGIQYTPTSLGALNGTVTVASNATGSPNTITVAGDGVSSASHVVSLSWKAGTSSAAAGYYVYRATAARGGYTRLNSSAVTGTTYSDASVVSGDTYSYQVTAVDSKGQESVPCSPVSAVIP